MPHVQQAHGGAGTAPRRHRDAAGRAGVSCPVSLGGGRTLRLGGFGISELGFLTRGGAALVWGAVFMLPLDALCRDPLGLLTEGRAQGTGRAVPPLLPVWGCFCSCPFWTLRLPFWGEIVRFCVTPRLKGQFLSRLWALGGVPGLLWGGRGKRSGRSRFVTTSKHSDLQEKRLQVTPSVTPATPRRSEGTVPRRNAGRTRHAAACRSHSSCAMNRKDRALLCRAPSQGRATDP